MTFDLAFTPQSHWIHTGTIGAANSAFPNALLQVPEKMYRRRLYASWRTDTGLNFTVEGALKFYLRGRLMFEQPWKRTGTGSGGELYFPEGTSADVDSVRFEISSNVMILLPHTFTVACDSITAEWITSTTSGGAAPISFFGCLSASHW